MRTNVHSPGGIENRDLRQAQYEWLSVELSCDKSLVLHSDCTREIYRPCIDVLAPKAPPALVAADKIVVLVSVRLEKLDTKIRTFPMRSRRTRCNESGGYLTLGECTAQLGDVPRTVHERRPASAPLELKPD